MKVNRAQFIALKDGLDAARRKMAVTREEYHQYLRAFIGWYRASLGGAS